MNQPRSLEDDTKGQGDTNKGGEDNGAPNDSATVSGGDGDGALKNNKKRSKKKRRLRQKKSYDYKTMQLGQVLGVFGAITGFLIMVGCVCICLSFDCKC